MRRDQEIGAGGKLLVVSIFLGIAMAASVASSYCLIGDFQSCFPAAKATGAEIPNETCCGLVRTVSFECLCQAISAPDASKLGVNITKALILPLKCGVSVPVGTSCAGFPVPY